MNVYLLLELSAQDLDKESLTGSSYTDTLALYSFQEPDYCTERSSPE